MASLFQRNGIWYAIFTVRYKQKWVKIGRMSKTSAKEVLRKLEQDYEKKKFGIVDEKLVSFKDYAEEYLTHSKSNKAKNSYERDKTSIKSLISFFGDIYLPRITPHLIEQYKTKRIA